MRRAIRFLLLVFPAAALLTGAAAVSVPEGPVTDCGRLMGTMFTVKVYADDRAGAANAIQRAFDEAAALQDVLSSRDARSELSALNDAPSGQAVEVGAELAAALAEAWRVADATGGAFDPTLGPCIRLWHWSKSRGRLPSADLLEAARAASGYGKLLIDGRRVTKTVPGMRIDLGGIGKGMAVDRMAAVLVEAGFPCYCITSTSDVRVGVAPPGRASWRVACYPHGESGDPFFVELVQESVSVSGAKRQFAVIEGVGYSHVIDPHTGLGLTGDCRGVIVLAPTSTEADALATACQVLPDQRAVALLAAFPGCRMVKR